MARTAGSNGFRTLELIRSAGLRLIYRHGYEGMNLRQLAAEVGIQPGSLYNHIGSKQDLLYGLVRDHMVELLARVDEALDGLDRPAARLEAFAAFHMTYHLSRQEAVFVANMELRSLDRQHYLEVSALRKAYEGKLAAIVAAGVAAGDFRAVDARVAAYAILSMLTGPVTWFRSSGRLSESEIVAVHVGLALRSIGAPAA